MIEETEMNAQIFTSPSGERMVILSEADYLAMVEAAEIAEDTAGVDRFEARLAAGTEELVPADVANALLNGANPVRVWRKHRGMSAKVLAEKAGIAPAYLSQIETGRREGTIETMRRIAIALDLTLGDLAG